MQGDHGGPPETRVIMLTVSTEEDAVVEAVAAGATGYLQKDTGLERLLSVVRGVAHGELHVPPQLCGGCSRGCTRKGRAMPPRPPA